MVPGRPPSEAKAKTSDGVHIVPQNSNESELMCVALCGEHSGFEARITSIEERVDKMENKLDSIHKLLVGTLAAAITSLILLAVNLGIKGGG